MSIINMIFLLQPIRSEQTLVLPETKTGEQHSRFGRGKDTSKPRGRGGGPGGPQAGPVPSPKAAKPLSLQRRSACRPPPPTHTQSSRLASEGCRLDHASPPRSCETAIPRLNIADVLEPFFTKAAGKGGGGSDVTEQK